MMKRKKVNFLQDHRLLILIFWSFLMLFLFSKSSPLYLFNDWVDANAFFTMGKGMARGLVPYRDLFEQKGPLLYFIHALASLISRKSFFGVYLFESFFMAINVICCYKISKMYFHRNLACILSMIFPLFLLPSAYFHQGDSAEEFALPFFMILIYGLFKAFTTGEKTNPLNFNGRFYAFQGFSVGCILLIKFTLLGPWIGFYMFMLIYLFIKRKKDCLKLIVTSAIGFFVAIIPWVIYFAAHSALKTFVYVYFYINLFLYPSAGGNFLTRVFTVIYSSATQYKALPIMAFFVLASLLLALNTRIFLKEKLYKYLLVCIYVSTVFFIYYGGRTYSYYFLFMTPFSIFAVLWLGELFKRYLFNDSSRLFKQVGTIGILVILLTCAYNSNIQESRLFPNNPTYVESGHGVRKPAQFHFADYIKKTNNPTLLNYRFLDTGVYLAADIMPTERYFELQNLYYEIYPDNLDAQKKCIAEKKVDFVTMLTSASVAFDHLDEPELKQNYKLVARHEQKRDGQQEAYWLFEKLP